MIAATHHAHLTGEEYNSIRAFRAGSRFIKDDSTEQQMVADLREQGLSFTETTYLINIDCIKNGRTKVSRSGVHTCEANMVREVLSIERRPQGNKDIDSKWEKCHYRWATQLLVRLGLKPELADFLNEDGSIPNRFNYAKLKRVNLKGIVWWDKVHKEYFTGDFCEGSTTQHAFLATRMANTVLMSNTAMRRSYS